MIVCRAERMASMSEDLFNDDEVSSVDDEENDGLVDEGQGPVCKECGEFLDGAGCPTYGRCTDCCECFFSDDLL
jgi:tRNA(Ile2) C34 agmatinyltransferase TiaS